MELHLRLNQKAAERLAALAEREGLSRQKVLLRLIALAAQEAGR